MAQKEARGSADLLYRRKMKCLIFEQFKAFLIQRRDNRYKTIAIKSLQLKRVFAKLREKHDLQKRSFEKERAARRKHWTRLTKVTLALVI
jgi:hypothetical protein